MRFGVFYGRPGHHNKEFLLYSKCNGKLLADFKKRHDIIYVLKR